jgi:hypothetical protein
VQSDEIDFSTGFHTPEGHLCLAVNYTAPPSGCAILTDPLLQVLDTSGVFATQVAGHDVDLTVNVAANGALSGSATADLDDNGSQETTSTPVKGTLRGKSGELRSKLSFALNNTALPAKLKLSRSESLSIASNTLAGTQRATGSIGSTKIKETTPVSGALPFAPLGWLIVLDFDEQSTVRNALLTLEGGRSFVLTGSNAFNFKSGLSVLKLRSPGKGIRIALQKVRLDDGTSPVGASGGRVVSRILGQTAKATLP